MRSSFFIRVDYKIANSYCVAVVPLTGILNASTIKYISRNLFCAEQLIMEKHENRMVEMRYEINIEYFIVGHHPSKTLA